MAATSITTTVQVSGYNHPSEDLLNGPRRNDYLKIAVPLYRASLEGNLKAAEGILKDSGDLVRCCISENKDTPLHLAAAAGHIKFVKYLVDIMSESDLELQNGDGNTAFCIAAISGNVHIAEIMFKKNPNLPLVCGSENRMPLFLAAFYGKDDMVCYLYEISDEMKDCTPDKKDELLLSCIKSRLFDVAIAILKENEELPQDYAADVLQLLARNPDAFQFERNHPLIGWTISKTHAGRFLKLFWGRIMQKPKNVIDDILSCRMVANNNTELYPSQILFIAAQMNNIDFLVELIREYPDLIQRRNADGQSIFHIAVAHRHREVYSLLYEIGSLKDLIISMTDKEGNNMLHLVGKNQEKNVFEDRVTTISQIFDEFLWYKEVESILPPPCREAKNQEGQTPRELFIQNHKELLSDGIESMNATITISMVVAALVCTIGFSVVFSVPGGFNQNNGFPMFLHNTYFIAFVVLDIISFILSTISIIFFLSLLLSRHNRDMEFLHVRWVIGQLLLLSSVFFIVMAFIVSLFIIYVKGKWKFIIYILAYSLVGGYSLACSSLFKDAARTITGKRFRPEKYLLYDKKVKTRGFS